MSTTDAQVIALWPTRIWLVSMHLETHRDVVCDLLGAVGSEAVLDVDPAAVLVDPGHAEALIAEAVGAAAPDRCVAGIQLSTQRWRAGHSIGLAYGAGDWSVRCVLSAAGGRPDAASGTLSLHDPRSGCAAVGVPGLPWGRPLTIKPEPGLAVVYPGWLGYSTTPIDAKHTVLILTADINLKDRP